MKTNTRGFIPLVAIILLGITAVAGGTIATISIKHNKQSNSQVLRVESGATTSPAYSAPVLTNVKSSAIHATSTPKAPLKERVGQIKTKDTVLTSGSEKTTQQTLATQITASLSPETQEICRSIQGLSNGTKSQRSLFGDLQISCKRLAEPEPDTQEQKDAWVSLEKSIQGKWTAWKNVQAEDTRIQQSLAAMTAAQSSPTVAVSTPAPTSIPVLPKTPKDLIPDKPIIESFCDSKGNCVHSWYADRNDNSQQDAYSFPTIHVGETLNFSVKLSGPESSDALVDFLPYRGGRSGWSQELTYTKTFTVDDINLSQYYMNVYIKSKNDNYHRMGGCDNGPCDDYTSLNYKVIP